MMSKKSYSATIFKQKCLSILSDLGPEGVVITRHGKAVATVQAVTDDTKSRIGQLKGALKFKGDLLSTGVKWNAQS